MDALLLTSSPFGKVLSKGERTRLRILEAATRLIAQKGLHNLTYDQLARTAKSTRQLVQTYYPDRDKLFEQCIQLNRFEFQRFVIGALEEAIRPQEKLTAYIDATFEWIDKNREKSGNLLFFYHLCVMDIQKKKINTGHADIGSKRIEALLAALPSCLPAKKRKPLAKAIQNVLVGNLVCMVTEQREPVALRKLAKATIASLIKEAASD